MTRPQLLLHCVVGVSSHSKLGFRYELYDPPFQHSSYDCSQLLEGLDHSSAGIVEVYYDKNVTGTFQ